MVKWTWKQSKPWLKLLVPCSSQAVGPGVLLAWQLEPLAWRLCQPVVYIKNGPHGRTARWTVERYGLCNDSTWLLWYEMVLQTPRKPIEKHLVLYIPVILFFRVISMDYNHPIILMHPYTNSWPQKVHWVVAASSKEWAWATTSTTPTRANPKWHEHQRKDVFENTLLRHTLENTHLRNP